MPANSQLKIMFWNAQSINSTSKRSLLKYTLINEKIDILLIVETFLKPIHSFKLSGYCIYRNDRLPQGHGGVAIAIRNGIPHKVLQPFTTKSIENIAIEVILNKTPTNIITAYSPKHTQHFMNDIEMLTSTNKQFLLFGDFNAKHNSWKCSVNNKAGNELFSAQQSSDFLIYHTSEHTHFPHSGQRSSTIDILLSNANFGFDFFTHPDQMGSDHMPTVCTINGQFQHIATKTFDYSRVNWQLFRQTVEMETNALPIPYNNDEIEAAVNSFGKILLVARNKCVPTKSITNKPKINTFTKQMIQLKNMLSRRMMRSPNSNESRSLKSAINKLQKKNKRINRRRSQ